MRRTLASLSVLVLAMGGCDQQAPAPAPRAPEATSAPANPTASGTWSERYRVETPPGARAIALDVGASFRLDDGSRFDVRSGRALEERADVSGRADARGSAAGSARPAKGQAPRGSRLSEANDEATSSDERGSEASRQVAERVLLDERSWLEVGEFEFTGIAGRFSPAVTLVHEGEASVVGPLWGTLLGASRGAAGVATLESRYDDGAHRIELVWRDPATLAFSRREALGAFDEPDAELRVGSDAVVVRTPARCQSGRCLVTIERFEPAQRRIASADAARLDASGEHALLVSHRDTGASVRVVETRDGGVRWSVDDGERGERCGDDPSARPRVEELALAPGGDVVALVESAAGQVWLRVVERAGEGGAERWSEDLADVPDVVFAEIGGVPILLVADGASVRAIGAR